ncbi:hypothetical protein BDV37DRAFT_58720 [Aspergillus pseudonomiae]|uniref:Uncharacterized protein n=1 Tax=Aspergillus pseudonomiae TaxID=1506151 RepID=A0A5N7DJK0_9EURO|nr:uncharacterized protein BDV37DRAFT_58720 [Aspergillus pseudonomiae]KAE8406607.1 hypothetical protein BDV37DRAFT_58720 [Aspergillus pseudonomiae]
MALIIQYLGFVALDELMCSNINPELRSLGTKELEDEDIVQLVHNKLLIDYAQTMSSYLTDDDLLLLSLITWQFDSSMGYLSPVPTASKDTQYATPFRELLHFFAQSSDENFNHLTGSYNLLMNQKISTKEFQYKFTALVRSLEKYFENE